MGWIKTRIESEYRKHYRVTGGLDWALLAEKKIIAELKDRGLLREGVKGENLIE